MGPGLGWGWPGVLTFVACNLFRCDLLFFNRGELTVVFLLSSLIIPRCLSSGWLWNPFYTEFIPTRVTSGATVSRNPEADEAGLGLHWLVLFTHVVRSAVQDGDLTIT